MKKLVEKQIVAQSIVEEDGGYITLLGKRVFLHCMNYNYAGLLSGVNTTTLELTDASVVFETGAYTSFTWKDAQKVPAEKLIVNLGSIEACWESNKT